jgi:hypothetical protein
MGKKKDKRRQAASHANWGQPGMGQGMGQGMYGGMAGANAGFAQGMYGGMDAGPAPAADPAALNSLFSALPGNQAGLLHGLQGMLGSRQTEQFILGALLGAAAVYVLGDEKMRGKLARTAMKLYAGVAGGVEEFKEQMADIRAEVEAEARNNA